MTKDARRERLVSAGMSKELAEEWLDFYDRYQPTTLELIQLMDETDPTMVAMRERKESK